MLTPFYQDDVVVEQMPPHIRDCIQIFTQDWKVVNKKSYPEPKEKQKDMELLEQVFEIGILPSMVYLLGVYKLIT
jgi:hypothetical protein